MGARPAAALAEHATHTRRPVMKATQESLTSTAVTTPSALQAPPMITADDIKMQMEARIQSAYEEAMAATQQQEAEPAGWWNIYAVGPIQSFGSPGPLPPHSIIKVGETAFVATVIVLNPFLNLAPGVTPLSVLSGFALPYEVRYQTGNLTTWSLAGGALNATHSGPGLNLIPMQPFYVDVLAFTATTPGLYEMNISARLLGAAPPFINAPQFAGYAREVLDLDADSLFYPFLPSIAPGFKSDQPIRFQVYP